MIYTVTFNPAVDYSMTAKSLNIGETNRSENEEITFGGKGINVSFVLNELGVQTTALGFVAGFTGDYILSELDRVGIKNDFIKLNDGFSRINVKLKGESETEINAQGPIITNADLEKLFYKLNNLKSGDILVLAGSIPSSLPDNIYEQILAKLKDKNIRFVVDATGDLLVNTLKYKPFLIKPNVQELEGIFKTEIKTDDEIVKFALKLKEMGAVNVLVSRGKDGAILIDEYSNTNKTDAYNIKLVNSVGAGDSMVAGFLAGYLKNNYGYALKLGTAAGAATTASKALAKRSVIEKLVNIK